MNSVNRMKIPLPERTIYGLLKIINESPPVKPKLSARLVATAVAHGAYRLHASLLYQQN
jgi:hypothetical protein